MRFSILTVAFLSALSVTAATDDEHETEDVLPLVAGSGPNLLRGSHGETDQFGSLPNMQRMLQQYTLPAGAKCTAFWECQSGNCHYLNGCEYARNGWKCDDNRQCQSNLCVEGKCNGGLPNGGTYCDSHYDCRSMNCEFYSCSPKCPDWFPKCGFAPDDCTHHYGCWRNLCVDGTCRNPTGQGCSFSRQCDSVSGSGICASGTCQGKLPTGSSCEQDFNCVSGFCYRNTCKEKLPTGSSCEEDIQCARNICNQVTKSPIASICGEFVMVFAKGSLLDYESPDSSYWGVNHPAIKVTDGKPIYIGRECKSCVQSHKEILYKRLTPWPTDMDVPKLFLNNWFDDGNKFNVDFKLYSSFADALDDKNPWQFCNFNDPGVGFPRDCGPTGFVGMQWSSEIGGWYSSTGQQDVAFYVFY